MHSPKRFWNLKFLKQIWFTYPTYTSPCRFHGHIERCVPKTILCIHISTVFQQIENSIELIVLASHVKSSILRFRMFGINEYWAGLEKRYLKWNEYRAGLEIRYLKWMFQEWNIGLTLFSNALHRNILTGDFVKTKGMFKYAFGAERNAICYLLSFYIHYIW